MTILNDKHTDMQAEVAPPAQTEACVCHTVVPRACCFPPQVSGEEIPKAIQLLPSETHGILLSANYLVVSDLVKWN